MKIISTLEVEFWNHLHHLSRDKIEVQKASLLFTCMKMKNVTWVPPAGVRGDRNPPSEGVISSEPGGILKSSRSSNRSTLDRAVGAAVLLADWLPFLPEGVVFFTSALFGGPEVDLLTFVALDGGFLDVTVSSSSELSSESVDSSVGIEENRLILYCLNPRMTKGEKICPRPWKKSYGYKISSNCQKQIFNTIDKHGITQFNNTS